MKTAQERKDTETKAAIAQKQEEMRMRALAFEQRDAARREREELKNNPDLAAERQRVIAEMKEQEDRLARMRAEEEEKIKAERRVEEKRMDQTEALIAAIRAQVEKEKAEKAEKEAANQKQGALKSSSNKSAAGGNGKPQFRTISPEEMQKLEERKRMKAAGIQPDENSTNVGGGISGGLGGLKEAPTLSNPNGEGPTLLNPNQGQQSLANMGMAGNGLGIEIPTPDNTNNADESTVSLNVDEINAALNSSESKENKDNVVTAENTWDAKIEFADSSDEISWVDTGVAAEHVKSGANPENVIDENGDIVSVIPVRQRPSATNDVQSVYNIDFDDDDDDDFINLNTSSAEEEAKRKAEEEARKAEEEARRKAEEEAKRKAEEEARRKAEEEARRKAEEEARRKAEEEARRKAEEEAKRKAEEEARHKAEEEARRKAEEEAKRKAEEEARRKAEE
ncbi:MAG: hypothetical protein PUC12_07495, partial [Clostridiales bacterium]|nr:hypothetical protein [Clostridiales bacterium]